MSRCTRCQNFGELHYTRCVDEYLCENCQKWAVEEQQAIIDKEEH